MIFPVLLILKIMLFMNITHVEHNKIFVILISSLFIFIFYSLTNAEKMKNKRYLNLVIYSIASLILFIDVLHYTYFNALPSVKMLSQVGQVVAVKESLLDTFTLKNILMVIDLPILIFLQKKYNLNDMLDNIDIFSKKNSKKVIMSLSVLLVITISGLVRADNFESVSNQEIFLYHYKDIKDTIFDNNNYEISKEEQLEIINDLKERANLKDGKLTGIGKDKNLILLQVESLQSFVINMEYLGQEITPNINKLIKDSGTIYFDKYYQMIGKGNTSDAEFSTNNSLYPSMTGASYVDYEQNKLHGLPWILREEGYNAWSFHGFKKSFWNREKAYKAQGFQRYISEEDLNVMEEDIIGFGLNDEKFFDESMNYIRELNNIDENPFYAFMITLTSHNPYKMPERHNVLEIEDKYENTIIGDYLQSVHYTDKQIGMFIEELKKEGIYEDSVIGLYGDHFGISAAHDDYQKLMTDFLGEEYTLEQMHNIPMLIHIPNEEINETVSKIGSHMDFLPTIMNIMGLKTKKNIMYGRDLLNFEGENYVAPQTYMIKGSFITEDEVFIMSRDGVFENSYAYDLNTNEEIDCKKYRDKYEKIVTEINLCSYILKNDLFEDVVNGDTNLELGYNIKLDKEIKSYNRNLKDINENLENGYNSLKVKLRFDKDDSTFYFGDDISIEEYIDLLEANEDIKTVVDFEELSLDALRRFFRLVKIHGEENDIQIKYSKMYPIADTFDEYHYLKTVGTEPIANIENMNFTEKERNDFLLNQNVGIVYLKNDDIKNKIIKEFNEKDIYIYTDVDSLKEYKDLNGIYGYIEY